MVRLATWTPSLSNSPRIRSAPQNGFSRARRWIRSMFWALRRWAGPRLRDFRFHNSRKPSRHLPSTQVRVPAQEGLRLHDLQDGLPIGDPGSEQQQGESIALGEAGRSCLAVEDRQLLA